MIFKNFGKIKILSLLLTLFFIFPIYSGGAKSSYIIKDYRKQINPGYKKTGRSSTNFIIVHTSEAGLSSTLRTVSKGKKTRGNYYTKGGHAHYVIARDGLVYRILDHYYRADHAGVSMWDGVADISSHSIGIELVGYHYDEITAPQYRSLALLLKELQSIYRIPDKNILAHCQVSYGERNVWFKKAHRGRKRCALNFDRKKAGLTDNWSYDPDVKAGRLLTDIQITNMFYKKRPASIQTSPGLASSIQTQGIESEVSNIISGENTAWNIAGEDFDSPDTMYILPGKSKKTLRGDRVAQELGWNRLPPGTQVLINQPLGREQKKGPIFQISREYTAWSFAGSAYRYSTTIYILRQNKIVPGHLVKDWDALPSGTKVIIGYKGPFLIQNREGYTPWGFAGKAYNHEETIYLMPGNLLVTGNRIKDFNDLPQGSKIFIKVNGIQSGE